MNKRLILQLDQWRVKQAGAIVTDRQNRKCRMTSPFRQLALQAAVALFVLSLAWPYFGMRAEAMPWAETAFVIGFLAFTVASLTKQPIWWRFMHGLFVPLAWAVTQLNIDPGWFLLAFIILLLIYRGALNGRVPLYLSNTATVEVLDGLLAERGAQRFLDLGAGLATTLLPLARRYPDVQFEGVENAPLVWLAGRWRVRAQPNIAWHWGDLWDLDLSRFDLVYAFLSPAPMAGLWQKVCAEMPAGSLFVSNSFAVPDVEPDWMIEVDGQPTRPLYCYRVVK